jgi:uncharacterized protein involved in exopolysaccharide biosynthesis
MPEPFEPYRYIGKIWPRWRLIAASVAAAGLLSLGMSLLMTRQYTATARIVIDPPAGTDLRSAMAVSPIYLESLRTYEQFASSDSLFLKAVEHFGLRGSGKVESLKKRVLKVGLVRNTRILEISAILPDPKKSQQLASYLADETVAMNRSLVTEADQDLIHSTEQLEAETKARLDRIEAEWARLLAAEPTEALQAASENGAALYAKIEQDALGIELEIADNAQREKQATPDALPQIRNDAVNARLREAGLRRQLDALKRQAAEREKLLSTRMAHRDRLDAERKTALAALAGIENRLRETRSDAGYRGERLKVIDPGVIPESPSSPNVPLNVAAGLLLGFAIPLIYLTLSMGAHDRRDAVSDSKEALDRKNRFMRNAG